MNRVLLLLLLLSSTGCASMGLASLKERMLYSAKNPDSDLGPAEAINAGQLKKNKVINDPAIDSRLNAIKDRITWVLPRSDIDFEIHVLDDKQVNAFTTGGRHLYFNKGLIDESKSDEELAAVMAHEMAHSLCRHVAKGRTISIATGLMQAAVMLASGGENRAVNTVSGLAGAAIPASFTRSDEKEADVLAAAFLKEAGYNLTGGQDFFKRLHEKEQSFNSQVSSTYLPALDLASSNYNTAVNNYNYLVNQYNANPTRENYVQAIQYQDVVNSYAHRYNEAESSFANFSLGNLGFFRTHPDSLSRAALFSKLDETFKGGVGTTAQAALRSFDPAAAGMLEAYEEVRTLSDAGFMTRSGAQALDAYRKAEKLFKKKRYDRARESLTTAIRLKDDYADAYRLRGECFIKEQKLTEARADFEKALALEPGDEGARRGLELTGK